MKSIESLEDLNAIIKDNDFVMIYFSHDSCNVCKALKPKVTELINSEFPKIELLYANTVEHPEISGQFGVFAVPTVIQFYNQRELFRKSRNFGIDELRELIEKPYNFTYSEQVN
jgi:thioredoxin 1